MSNRVGRILLAFLLSWLVGIGCLFVSLQFSPPRWSMETLEGALFAALRSSAVYDLPLLAFLALRAGLRGPPSPKFAAVAAFIWVCTTVLWWASAFSPIPVEAGFRNLLLLLPSALVPALTFCWFLHVRE